MMKKSLFTVFCTLILFLITSCAFNFSGGALQLILPGNPDAVRNTSRSVKIRDIKRYELTISSTNGEPVFKDGKNDSETKQYTVLPEPQKIILSDINAGSYVVTLSLYTADNKLISTNTKTVNVLGGKTEVVSFVYDFTKITELELPAELPGSKEKPITDFDTLRKVVEDTFSSNYITVIYIDGTLGGTTPEFYLNYEMEHDDFYNGIIVPGSVKITSVNKNEPASFYFHSYGFMHSLFYVMDNAHAALCLENVNINGVEDPDLPDQSPVIYAGKGTVVTLQNVNIQNFAAKQEGDIFPVIIDANNSRVTLDNVVVSNSSYLVTESGDAAAFVSLVNNSECHASNVLFTNCNIENVDYENTYYVAGNSHLYLSGTVSVNGIGIDYDSDKNEIGYLGLDGDIEFLPNDDEPDNPDDPDKTEDPDNIEVPGVIINYLGEARTYISNCLDYNIFTDNLTTKEIYNKSSISDAAKYFEVRELEGKVLVKDGTLALAFYSLSDFKDAIENLPEGTKQMFKIGAINISLLGGGELETISISNQKQITIKSATDEALTLAGIRFYLSDESSLKLENVFYNAIGENPDKNALIQVNNRCNFTAVDTTFSNFTKGVVIQVGENNLDSTPFTSVDLTNVFFRSCGSKEDTDYIIGCCGYTSAHTNTVKLNGVVFDSCNSLYADIELSPGTDLLLQGTLGIGSIKQFLNQKPNPDYDSTQSGYIARTGKITLAKKSMAFGGGDPNFPPIALYFEGDVPEGWNIFSQDYTNPSNIKDTDKSDVTSLFDFPDSGYRFLNADGSIGNGA